MIRIFKHENGSTETVDRVDPAWIKPGSGIQSGLISISRRLTKRRILSEVFHFHELAIEDALSELHHPKVESYGDYLYLILHGIDFQASEHCFTTKDIDFFLGEQYLVTVHPGVSRSIGRVGDVLQP